jgi:hypothetical protein
VGFSGQKPEERAVNQPATDQTDATSHREANALYQKGKVVARVVQPEIDQENRTIRFDEISNSDELLLPEECEFREFRIQIRKITYATKIERDEEHKGRVLRGVMADLVGMRDR